MSTSLLVPSRDYLFIDESGDPGKKLETGSSEFFFFGALHLTDISLQKFMHHYCAFGYYRETFREIKSSRLSRASKDQISDLLKWMCTHGNVRASVLFINKGQYTGPYWKTDSTRPHDPVLLRNFLFGKLLEKHFKTRPPFSSECELVIDEAISEAAEANLKQYLRNNWSLPNIQKIVQCDSRYVPMLQIADVLTHLIKKAILGEAQLVDVRLLDFVEVIDLTHPIKRVGNL